MAALDRLSERLLVAARPLLVGVADAAPERQAAYRLRGRHVIDAGWAGAEELPEGLERDAHDDDAVHICARIARTLVGTARLVLPVAGRRLPVEAAFDLDIEPRGAVVEVGRLVIAASHRGDPAHRAWGALFAFAWLSIRERGFTVMAGAASAHMVDKLQALGLPFETLAPARPYWGEERHPVRLDPSRAVPSWFNVAP